MPIVDERIVKLGFNNKEFEEGTKESLSTMDKLNKALKFEGCVEALKSLQNAGKQFTMDSAIAVVTDLNQKVGDLGYTVKYTFESMVYQAQSMASNLSRSLSVDQIFAGWDKYAMKTKGVQTIMAATSEEFKGVSNQMELVEAQLEKLNWFTDETSYSFSDMVDNIGKFTSNNIKLEDSVRAMEGISVWAARSGGGVNEASRAMYNLSQAMSAGVIKYQDWRSIELANMSTTELKKTVLEAGAAIGKLRKGLNDTYYSGGTMINVENFSKNLSTGWFTKEIFMKAMDMYGAFTDELYKFSEATGETATQSLQMIEQYSKGTLNIKELSNSSGKSVEELTQAMDKLSSKEMELGRNAFKSAQEAKTFTEAIDATKDAVSTGWMTTWEHIFGNYEEAKVLWTRLANELYDIFADWGNDRNEILKMWHRGIYEENKETGEMILVTEGAYKAWMHSLENIWEGIKGMIAPITEAFDSIFGASNVERAEKLISWTKQLESVTGRFRKFFEPVSDEAEVATMSIDKLLEKMKEDPDIYRDRTSEKFWEHWKKMLEGNTELVAKMSEKYAEDVERVNPVLDNTRRIFVAIFSVMDLGFTVAKRTIGVLADGAKTISKLLMQVPLLSELANIGDNIKNFANSIKESTKFSEFFDTASEKLNEHILSLWWHITSLYKTISESESLSRLVNNLKTLGGILSRFKTKVLNQIGDAFEKIGDTRFTRNIKTIATSLGRISIGALNKGLEFIINHKDAVKKFFDIFTGALATAITGVSDAFAMLTGKISDFAGVANNVTSGALDWISNTFGSLGETLTSMTRTLGDWIVNTFGVANDVLTGEGGFFQTAGSVFAAFVQAIVDGVKKLKVSDLLGTMIKVALALRTVTKVIKAIKSALGLSKGIFDTTTEGVKKLLKLADAAKDKLQSEAVWNYAKAVAAVSASIFFLCLVPTDKLLKVAGIMLGIATVLGVLWVAYKKFTQEDSEVSPGGIFGKLSEGLQGFADAAQSFSVGAGLSMTLLSFAASVAIIAKVLKGLVELSKEDQTSVQQALGVLVILSGGMVAVAALLSKFATNFKMGSGVALLLFSVAVGILGKVLASIMPFAVENPDALNHATGNLAMLMGGLAGVAILISKFGGGVSLKSMLGLVIFAASIGMLIGSLKSILELSKEDQTAVQQAMGVLSFMVLGLVGVSVLLGKFGSGNSIASMAGLFIFTMALQRLVGAVKDIFALSVQDQDALTQSIGMISVLMLELAGLAAGLSFLKVNPLPMIGLAAALLIFAKAVSSIKPLPPGAGDTVDQIVGLLLTISVIAGALSFISAGLAGVGLAFLELAGAFTLTCVGLRIIVDKLPQLALGLQVMGPAIIKFATDIGKGIVSFIDSMLKALDEKLPSIMETLESIFTKLTEYTLTVVPKIGVTIWKAVTKLIDFLADSIPEYAPKLLRAILRLLDAILDFTWNVLMDASGWLAQKINDLFESVFNLDHVDITPAFDKIKAWGNNLLSIGDDWEEKGKKAAKRFNDGVEHTIGKFEVPDTELPANTFNFVPRTDEAADAGSAEGYTYATSFLAAFDGQIGDWNGMFEGLDKEGAMAQLNMLLSEMGMDANELLGSEGLDAGGNFMINMQQGLNDNSSLPEMSLTSLHDFFSQETQGIVDSAYPAGSNFARGVADGINADSYLAISAAQNLATNVVTITHATLQENSPSRIGRGIGKNWSIGIGLGIDDKADDAVQSTANLGRRIIESTRVMMAGVNEYINSDASIEPTITPVFDGSNIQNGVASINRMFNSRSAVMAGINHRVLIDDSERRKAERYSDRNVIRAIYGLDSSINSLGGAMSNMDIVMDSGRLVGSISNKMNTQLGRTTRRRHRR